jgi:hypothetical protein
MGSRPFITPTAIPTITSKISTKQTMAVVNMRKPRYGLRKGAKAVEYRVLKP